MFSLRHLDRYILAAAALGCLSINAFSTVTEPGLINQELFVEEATAYRGTGRNSQEREVPVAHRGSGRIDNDTADTNDVAYRGSGRVSPYEMQAPDYA